jgi:DNA-directed RNA polymerase subunit RPC12/RpoP
VWWRCKEDHSYKSAVATRTSGVGCPICDGKVILTGYNDLMTQNPQLAAEWNYDRNGNLTPDQVAPFSNKKVWWKCEKGHEWESRIATRNQNSNCPYCGNKKLLSGFNDLATRFPELALDWDYTKNEQTPSQVLAGDKSKKIWICKECGHSYEKSVYNKVRSPKCPKCKK